MSDNTVENLLMHYGKKGMKWGVRTSKSRPLSSDAKAAKSAYAKAQRQGVSSLTNDQLKTLNTRLQLERQYKDLNPATRSKGAKFVSRHLTQIAGMAISAAATRHLIRRI